MNTDSIWITYKVDVHSISSQVQKSGILVELVTLIWKWEEKLLDMDQPVEEKYR